MQGASMTLLKLLAYAIFGTIVIAAMLIVIGICSIIGAFVAAIGSGFVFRILGVFVDIDPSAFTMDVILVIGATFGAFVGLRITLGDAFSRNANSSKDVTTSTTDSLPVERKAPFTNQADLDAFYGTGSAGGE